MDSKRKILSEFLSELTERDDGLSSKFSSDWDKPPQKSALHRNFNIGIAISIVFGYIFILQLVVIYDFGLAYMITSLIFGAFSLIIAVLAMYTKSTRRNNLMMGLSVYLMGFVLFLVSLKAKHKMNESGARLTVVFETFFNDLTPADMMTQLLLRLTALGEETVELSSIISLTTVTLFSSLILSNSAYLIVEEFSYAGTIVFCLIGVGQLYWMTNDVLNKASLFYMATAFVCFFGLVVTHKYYLNRAITGANQKNVKLSKIEHFYYEWILGLDAAYCLVKEGKVTFSNKKFEATIGLFKFDSELKVHNSFTSQIDKGMTWSEVNAILNSTETLDFSKLGVFKLHEQFFECRLSKYSTGFIEVFLSDITSSVLQERAKIEEKYRNTVFAKIAHEFKTPITNIVLLIDKLKDKLKGEATEELQMMKGLSDYVIFLVSDITSYFTSGSKFNIIPEPTELAEVCEFCFNVLSSLIETKSSAKKNVKAYLELSSRLRLNIDQIRLKQVILNIVSNSAKFTTHGSIKLSCFEEADYIVLAVTDEGIGISADKLNQLRKNEEIKFQVRDEYNKMGSGLGLSISKQICDEMGLSFNIESEIGKGTKTTVKIPKGDFMVESEADTTIETVVYDAPYIFLNPTEVERPVVIIAEDNSVIRKSIRSLVEQLSTAFNKDWLVIEVEDGIFALSEIVNLALEGRKIDFMITDEFMDFLDGSRAITLLKALMSEQKIPKFPCLSCSAFEDDAFRERIESCGADQVIAKPASKERLVNVLKAERILQ